MYLPRASVTYRLVAYVHRPGTFTARLQSIQEVRIVACPSLSDADEGGGHQEEGVVVDREWEDQLRYRIELDRKKMEIGSDLKLKMTVMPLEKVKIWRISAYLGGTSRSIYGLRT
jgi:arrestin-related trafficking adapter 3/6